MIMPRIDNISRIRIYIIVSITGVNFLCVCFKDILPIEVFTALLIILPVLRVVVLVCFYRLLCDMIRKVNDIKCSKSIIVFISAVCVLCTIIFVFVFYKMFVFWSFRQNSGKYVLIAAVPFFLIWLALCAIAGVKMFNRGKREKGVQYQGDKSVNFFNSEKTVSSTVRAWMMFILRYLVLSVFYCGIFNGLLYLGYCLDVSHDIDVARGFRNVIYETWDEESKSFWADTGFDYTTMEERCNFFDFAESEFCKRVLKKSDYDSEEDFMKRINNDDLEIQVFYDFQYNDIETCVIIPSQKRVNDEVWRFLKSLIWGGL